MIGALGRWLAAIIAVSLLCAVADSLMPSGPVKRVGRLVCGLVMAGALLSPLARLDMAGGTLWLDSFLASVQSWEAELEETVNSQLKTVIEQQSAAYIVDKAAELGLSCRARVECRLSEDGLYLPVRTEVTGAMTADVQAKLIRMIREDLGVPDSSQIYISEEEMP